MGVEYEHWILPRDRDFRPDAGTFARLVEALRAERWVGNEDASAHRSLDELELAARAPRAIAIPEPVTAAWVAAQTKPASPRPIENELALLFPVSVDSAEVETWAEAGLRFPFTVGSDDPTNSHDLYLILTDDFVAHGSTNGFPSALDGTCACGMDLAYEPRREVPPVRAGYDGGLRIRRTCPRCGVRFDPRSRTQIMRRDYDGPEVELTGGITFRFAVRIDCQKAWPRSDTWLALDPALPALIAAVVGTPLEDAGAFY